MLMECKVGIGHGSCTGLKYQSRSSALRAFTPSVLVLSLVPPPIPCAVWTASSLLHLLKPATAIFPHVSFYTLESSIFYPRHLVFDLLPSESPSPWLTPHMNGCPLSSPAGSWALVSQGLSEGQCCHGSSLAGVS